MSNIKDIKDIFDDFENFHQVIWLANTVAEINQLKAMFVEESPKPMLFTIEPSKPIPVRRTKLPR